MENKRLKRLMKVLRTLVYITFCCNLLALLAVLAVFLLVCGSYTAFILWQAGCFVISIAALCRTVWGFFYYQSLEPLLTYNFLFCLLFFMGGLLFLVMSALFQQAAEMREEQELTI